MRQLRAAYAVTRDIALTGLTSPEDVQACLDAGFSTFLPKPVSVAALLTEVKRLI